jgi:hypothetical protein
MSFLQLQNWVVALEDLSVQQQQKDQSLPQEQGAQSAEQVKMVR